MIDHELRRSQRVDLVRITAEPHDGIAHCREIHDAGHAGKILENHPSGGEGNLVGRCGLRIPGEHGLDIRARDVDSILETQQVLEQDFQRVGQAGHLLLRQAPQAPDLIGAICHTECRARLEAVGHGILRNESAASRNLTPLKRSALGGNRQL